MKRKIPLPLLLSGTFALFSPGCEKRVIDVYAVIETTPLNIDTPEDITAFDILDAQTFIAGSREGIHHSTDGGNTWRDIDLGLNNADIHSIQFIDNMRGTVVGMDDSQTPRAAYTTDGGRNWTGYVGREGLGFADDGRLIAVTATMPSFGLDESTDNGLTWRPLTPQIWVDASGDFIRVLFHRNKVYLLSTGVPFERRIPYYDLDDPQLRYLDLPESEAMYPIQDIYTGPSGEFCAGDIGTVVLPTPSGSLRPENYHSYTYHAVDGVGDVVYFVGDHSIATNLDLGDDRLIREVFQPDLNGFDVNFHDIEFLNDSIFYLSGSAGTFWRAKR